MRRRVALTVCGTAMMLLAAPASPAAADRAMLFVTLDRTTAAVSVGSRFSFTSVLANDGQAATGQLVATLNVTSLDDGVYVDPEDWSGERTRYLRPLRGGQKTALRWDVQAVTTGRVAIYVSVLSRAGGAAAPVSGPTLQVTVAERPTIDPGGALVLALIVPALVALLALSARLARRRHT